MHVSRFVLPGTNYDKERRFALGMGYPNIWDAASAALWVRWRCVCVLHLLIRRLILCVPIKEEEEDELGKVLAGSVRRP